MSPAVARGDPEFPSFSPEVAEEWDTLVRQSDDGWPFALSCWQRLILAVPEWGLSDHSFALRENGGLLAVMPLQFNVASRVMASSGWGGAGPVVASGLSPKHRHRVLRAVFDYAETLCKERGAERLEFWTSPVTHSSITASWGVNPFVFHGLEDRSGVSQVIDLSPKDEDLWRSVSETARHAVRKGRSAGYTVAQEPWPDLLDAYYETHATTYRRTGVTPHPKAYFAGIAAELWPQGHAVLWVARDAGGAPVAFHNAMWFGEGGMYHTACSIEQASHAGANYLLFWHALLGAKAAGVRWYDCGEIFPSQVGDKRAGLTTFKTKFGGEAHRFFKCSMRFAPEASKVVNVDTGTRSALSRVRRAVSRLLGSG